MNEGSAPSTFARRATADKSVALVLL